MLRGAFAAASTARTKRSHASGINSIPSLTVAFAMAPQPLSRVHPTANVRLSDDAISQRPKLSRFIPEIIARWTGIEIQLAATLSGFLRAEAAPVTAMLHAINSISTQMDMILAAGSSKLYDPELEALEAVVKIAKAAAKKRNRIVHHVWGLASELPDALLLVDPEACTEKYIKAQEAARSGQPAPEVNREQVMVYREKDFIEILQELDNVRSSLTLLNQYLEPGHRLRDRVYGLLCGAPLMDAALKSIRNSRQARPRPEPPSTQTGSGSTGE